jgi:eukaryotic-like serine/threonine-protein kinase
VSYLGAQGTDRVPATLYIPKRAIAPRQTVVIMPGSNALYERSIDGIITDMFGFLMRSGRTVVVPELRGMLTRMDPSLPTNPAPTLEYRDVVVSWGKDVRRTVDYLATRADADTARVAFLGLSMGARLGGVLMGIEPRFRTGILYAGGLGFAHLRPEVDPLNFLPRVTAPVLMLNGRYDDVFPTETSQRPYFRLLGSAPEHKRQVVFDDGHILPRAQVASESVAWLDRYLGVVKR